MEWQLGFLTIRAYGVMIALGLLAGTLLAASEARRRGLSPSLVWDAVPWLTIGGIVGARLWHILTPPASMRAYGITTEYYLTHPLEAIAIWKGGLGLPGVVIGGALALWLYTRRQGLDYRVWLDLVAPALPLGQAIGRWGNYFNQELYGRPTDLPWKIFIDPAHRLPGYENVAYYHPLFAYEMVWNLLNMAALLYIARRWARRLLPGDLFLMYLAIYGFGRFWLEFLRLDISPVAGLNVNQTLMLAVTLGAVVTLVLRHRRAARLAAEDRDDDTAARPARRRKKRKKK